MIEDRSPDGNKDTVGIKGQQVAKHALMLTCPPLQAEITMRTMTSLGTHLTIPIRTNPFLSYGDG